MEKLTVQEEEVMLYFWKMDASFIRDIIDAMPEPRPPYTTVASIVKNLEKKGYLQSQKVGNSTMFHILIPQTDYKRQFMGNVVSNYFTGSYKELVSFFVKDRKISKEELKDLIELIENGDNEEGGKA